MLAYAIFTRSAIHSTKRFCISAASGRNSLDFFLTSHFPSGKVRGSCDTGSLLVVITESDGHTSLDDASCSHLS